MRWDMETRNILVVDDDPDIITYLTVLLEDKGYKVLGAQSVREAQVILEKSKPDLVCLDIMMPRQSGIALYSEFKLDDRLKEIPTIFISAFSLARDFYGDSFRKLIPDTRVPEPEAYMEKPIEADKLLEIIERTVG